MQTPQYTNTSTVKPYVETYEDRNILLDASYNYICHSSINTRASTHYLLQEHTLEERIKDSGENSVPQTTRRERAIKRSSHELLRRARRTWLPVD